MKRFKKISLPASKSIGKYPIIVVYLSRFIQEPLRFECKRIWISDFVMRHCPVGFKYQVNTLQNLKIKLWPDHMLGRTVAPVGKKKTSFVKKFS